MIIRKLKGIFWILYIVLTDSTQLVRDANVHAHPHQFICTDHSIITFSIRTTTSPSGGAPSYVLDYSHASMDAMADYLLETDFDTIFSLDDVEMIWTTLMDIIVNAISRFVLKV